MIAHGHFTYLIKKEKCTAGNYHTASESCADTQPWIARFRYQQKKKPVPVTVENVSSEPIVVGGQVTCIRRPFQAQYTDPNSVILPAWRRFRLVLGIPEGGYAEIRYVSILLTEQPKNSPVLAAFFSAKGYQKPRTFIPIPLVMGSAGIWQASYEAHIFVRGGEDFILGFDNYAQDYILPVRPSIYISGFNHGPDEPQPSKKPEIVAFTAERRG